MGYCTYEGCGRDVYKQEGYPETDKCIFHAEKKDATMFYDVMEIELEKWARDLDKPWEFRGWRFPDVSDPKTLCNTLRKRPQLNDHYLDFTEAVFMADIDFLNQIFRKGVSFKRARYKGNALFQRCSFPSGTSFAGSRFYAISDFSYATFQNGTSFQGSRFRNAIFEKATFRGEVHFAEALFLRNANFEGTTFAAISPGVSAWNKAIFREGVNFTEAEFKGSVQFRETRFLKNTYFKKAIFHAEVDFEAAQLHGDLWFWKATFEGYVGFKSAMLAANFNMNFASFAVLCKFEMCRVVGHTKFAWPGDGVKRDKEGRAIERGNLQFKKLTFENDGVLDIRENVLDDDSKLTFDRCHNMSKVLLSGTDCTQIKFHNCRWDVLDGRKAIGDEFFSMKNAKKEVEWSMIAITYMQLTEVYRKKHDHLIANDFERGIFEMRRHAAWQEGGFREWSHSFLYSAYKLLSYYSGSLLLPLFWLLLVTFVSAGLYERWLYGGRITICGGAFPAKGLIASLRIIGLDRAWLTKEFPGLPNELWVTITATGQLIFSATLVALFLFAMRRRFKH